MRLLRQFYTFYYFFTKRFYTHKKAQKSTEKQQKHKKHKNTTKQKHKNVNKRTKIKNAIKKHLRRKNSLSRVFAFLCLLRARRKENRK